MRESARFLLSRPLAPRLSTLASASTGAWAIEPSWAAALKAEPALPYFKQLRAFVDSEREEQHVLPAAADTFAAFRACPFDRVKVVIIGQDPYPTPGHATGLAFSVPSDVRPLPGSLQNVFTALQRDLAVPPAPPVRLV